jgi:hypothetical protein
MTDLSHLDALAGKLAAAMKPAPKTSGPFASSRLPLTMEEILMSDDELLAELKE